jgi:subtilase family serine protease
MMNTATVTSGNLTASSSATVTVTGPFKPTAHFNAQLSNQGLAYTPDQIRSAYGVNNLSLDGAGQTIAIVDAYDNPAIIQSLDTFDQQFATTSGSSANTGRRRTS